MDNKRQKLKEGIGSLNIKYVERLELFAIDFVFNNLAAICDASNKVKKGNEEAINEQLCCYLDAKARLENMPFIFVHEKRQVGKRRIDFSAHNYENFLIAQSFESIQNSITVFEAKRLPLPRRREKEYITGGANVSGGIQRFKLGVHGRTHRVVAIVGYIQKNDAAHFYNLINQWLADFACQSPDGLLWEKNEQLKNLSFARDSRVARMVSHHKRKTPLASICLHHLWVTI